MARAAVELEPAPPPETVEVPVYVPPGSTVRVFRPVVLAWLVPIAMLIYNNIVGDGKTLPRIGSWIVELHQIGGWWFVGAIAVATATTLVWLLMPDDMPSVRALAWATVGVAILAVIFSGDYNRVAGGNNGPDGDDLSRIEALIGKRAAEAADQDMKPGPSTSGGVECVDGCIFEDGLVGKTPEAKFKDLQRKIVNSPAAAEGFARAIRHEQGKSYDVKSKGARRFSENLYIVFGFFLDAKVEGGVIPKGTKVLNTTLRNGVVSQFPDVLKKDREYILISKDGTELRVFTTCGNFVTEKVPGITIVKPPPPKPKPPPQVCVRNCGPVNTPKPCNPGEFCGTPHAGPDKQPVDDNNPDHVAPTEGYDGDGEEIIDSQEQPDDGDSRPGGIDGDAPPNPDGGADDGTSDPHPDDDGFNEEPPNDDDPGGFN